MSSKRTPISREQAQAAFDRFYSMVGKFKSNKGVKAASTYDKTHKLAPTKVISDSRYLSARGPHKWDFQGVDLGDKQRAAPTPKQLAARSAFIKMLSERRAKSPARKSPVARSRSPSPARSRSPSPARKSPLRFFEALRRAATGRVVGLNRRSPSPTRTPVVRRRRARSLSPARKSPVARSSRSSLSPRKSPAYRPFAGFVRSRSPARKSPVARRSRSRSPARKSPVARRSRSRSRSRSPARSPSSASLIAPYKFAINSPKRYQVGAGQCGGQQQAGQPKQQRAGYWW